MLFDNKVEQGAFAEKEVQKKLWKFNYSVKKKNRTKFKEWEMAKQGFDLLVEEKIRVEVKSTVINKHNSWSFMVNFLSLEHVDFYAFVFFYPDKSFKIRFLKIKDLKNKMSEYAISFKSPDEEGLIKSPYKAFGRPQTLSTQSV